MAIRFTQTEKWKDIWFRKLPIEAKLLFMYLCENCDIAGFWEIDFETASFQTGLPLKQEGLLENCKSPFRPLPEVFEGVSRAYIKSGNFIWVKNFLYYQKNLPLNPNSTFHKGILKVIHSHNSFGDKVLKEIDLIIKNKGLLEVSKTPERGLKDLTGNSKGNSKGKEGIVKGGKLKLFPIIGKTCSVKDCKLPAVYKKKGCNHDSDAYCCQEHLPKEVKEIYG
jgi:hypothetical protein